MTMLKGNASLSDNQKNFMATLASIVGPQFAASDMSSRYIYAQDLTENEPCLPLGVVMPETSEDVRQIVLAANRFGIPLVPFAYGLNMGGLTIPGREAVVVDLKRMQAISEVNEDEKYGTSHILDGFNSDGDIVLRGVRSGEQLIIKPDRVNCIEIQFNLTTEQIEKWAPMFDIPNKEDYRK